MWYNLSAEIDTFFELSSLMSVLFSTLDFSNLESSVEISLISISILVLFKFSFMIINYFYHKKFLSSKLLRRILIFTVAFIATRDLIVSLVITAAFIIFVLNLFNNESQYCILPKSFKELDLNNDGEISPEEIKKAYETLKKAGKIN